MYCAVILAEGYAIANLARVRGAEANERRRESRTLPMAEGGSLRNYKSPAALAGCLYHLQAVTRGCYESCEYFHHIHKHPPNKIFFFVCSSIPSRDATNFPCMMAHQFGCLQPKRVQRLDFGWDDKPGAPSNSFRNVQKS